MEDLRQYVHYYFFSTATYALLYYFVAARVLPVLVPAFSRLTVDQKKEWVSNTASIVTSLICGLGTLSGLGMGQLESNVKFNILQILVKALTGYWLSDTIFRLANMHVLKNRRFQCFLLVHHLLGIVAVQVAVLHREMMNVKLMFILMELGSLFINVRFCLLDLNFDRSSPVYEGVSYAMIATFFVTRLLPVPYMYYEAGYKCIWLGRICSAACRPYIAFNAIFYSIFTGLNCYWFYIMLTGLAKHGIRKRLEAHSNDHNLSQQPHEATLKDSNDNQIVDTQKGEAFKQPIRTNEDLTSNQIDFESFVKVSLDKNGKVVENGMGDMLRHRNLSVLE